jgi:hypothetical protein
VTGEVDERVKWTIFGRGGFSEGKGDVLFGRRRKAWLPGGVEVEVGA